MFASERLTGALLDRLPTTPTPSRRTATAIGWPRIGCRRQPPEEAAIVDGCRRPQALWVVLLPLTTPGLIAAGLLSFLFSWSEFSIALNLTAKKTMTIPVAIAAFASPYEIQHGEMAAASVLSTVPAILLMFFGQRFIIRGLTAGAVK